MTEEVTEEVTEPKEDTELQKEIRALRIQEDEKQDVFKREVVEAVLSELEKKYDIKPTKKKGA